MPVGEIVSAVGLAQSTVSQHLKVLTEAGLVARQVAGQQRLYSLQLDGFKELTDWLERTRWFYENGRAGGI